VTSFGLGIILNFTDNASAKMAGVTSAFDNMNNAADKSQRTFVGFAKSVGGIGKALTAGITLPLIGVAQRIARTGIEKASLFQNMQLALDTLLPEDINTGTFIQGLDEMGRSVPVATRYFLKGAQNLIMFGAEADNVKDMLQVLTDVAGGTGRGLNGFNSSVNYMGIALSTGIVNMNSFQAMIRNTGIQADRIIGNMLGITDANEAMQTAFRLSRDEGEKFVEMLMHGLRYGTDGALGFTAAFEGAGKRLLETFDGAKKYLTDAWDNVGIDVLGINFDEYGMKTFHGMDYVTRAMTNLAKTIQGLAPLFQPMIMMTFQFFERISEMAKNAITWFNNLSESTQSFVSRVLFAVALLGPALTLFGVFGGTILPKLTAAFKGAAVGIGKLISFMGPWIALAGILYLVWTRNLGGIQDHVSRFWGNLTASFGQGVERVLTTIRLFRSAWADDGWLSIEDFDLMESMGLTNAVSNLLMLRYRLGYFFEGFQTALSSFVESFSDAFGRITSVLGGFGFDAGPLTALFDALSGSDPEKWRLIGEALGQIIVPMVMFKLAMLKLKGISDIGSLFAGFGMKLAPLKKILLPIGLVVGLLKLFYLAWEENFLGIRDLIQGIDWQGVLGKISDFWSKTVGRIVEFGQYLWSRIQPIIGNVIGIFQDVVYWFRNSGIKTQLMVFAALFVSAFQGIKDIVDRLRPVFRIVFDFILTVIGSVVSGIREHLLPVFLKIVERVMSFVNTVMVWVNILIDAVREPIEALVGWIVRAWDGWIRDVVENVIGFVSRIAEILGLLAVWVYDNFIQPIIGFATILFAVVAPIISKAISLVIDIFGNLFNMVGGIISGIIKVINGLIDFIVGVFTGDWGRAWEGVKSIFEGIVTAIQSIFKGVINHIITAINAFIRGINLLRIPNWVPGIGGKGINIPLIPHLQTGGMITQAGAAYLHPAEVVLNSRLTKGLDEIVSNSKRSGTPMSIKPGVESSTIQIHREGIAPSPKQVSPLVRNNNASSTPALALAGGGDVHFEKGSIHVTVAQATPAEAERFANLIYDKIKRKQELEKMKSYQNRDHRNQGVR